MPSIERQLALGEVVADQRRRFPVVGHQTGLQRLGIVVGADRAACGHRLAGPVLDPRQKRRVVDLELDDGIELLPLRGQQLVERRSLLQRAREAVEDEAVGAVRLARCGRR